MVREVRGRATELQQKSNPVEEILPAYRKFVISGGGLIEGPGLFAGVAYLVSGHPGFLVAALLAPALLLAHFPTMERARRLAQRATEPA
jgi:hypothetical protein